MISVIIPIYNAEKYIERCLDSIFVQTYEDFEIIAVDDGSTDLTAEILKQYSKKDERIKIIKKRNGGSASARNLALKYVNGKYVIFIDADDYVSCDFLRTMVCIAEETKADIVECDYQIVRGKKEQEKVLDEYEYIRILTNMEKLEELCKKSTYMKSCVLWTKLYRTELFQGIKFIENKGIDDEFVIHKLIYRAKLVAITNRKLYYYCLTDNSQMRAEPSIKRIDNTEAIEAQLMFYKSIGSERLYNMLLYRYFRTVNGNLRFLKKNYPEQEEIILKFKKKRKKIYYAFKVKEIPILDKIFLFMDFFMPYLARIVHDMYIWVDERKK